MRLQFCLILDSDYHVGAGHGIGSQTDSALLRDDDGVPVLRSTIQGLLRDGLRRLLQESPLGVHFQQAQERHHTDRVEAEDGGVAAYCAETDDCPLCRIMGTPVVPKRWFVSSARPVGLEGPLQRRPDWSGAQVAARVRIDPRVRRAEPRKLFRQEEGDRRLVFTFTVDGPPDSEMASDEAALLVAGARMVRRLGSARRRGRGACILHVAGPDGQPDREAEDQWLTRFEKAWLNHPRTIKEIDGDRSTTAVWTRTLRADHSPVRRRIIVRTDEPVVIASRAEAGNLFDGLDHINGTTLWGALATHAAEKWQLKGQDDDFYRSSAAYQAFRDLLLRGWVRISPLYPAYQKINTLYATIPAPLDLLTCKVYRGFQAGENDLDHHGAWGYADQVEMDADCRLCQESGNRDIPLVPVGGFLPVKQITEQSYNTRLRSELHPRINPVTQRVAGGDLYGYVALETGQFFMGEIWSRNQDAWDALCELTGVLEEETAFNLRLGKAIRRGYGKVTVYLEEAGEIPLWYGQPLDKRKPAPSPDGSLTLTLTLLTDTILPDAWGRFRQTLDDPVWLEELLNHPFAEEKPFCLERDEEGRPQTINTFCQTRHADGFNNQLGLPRWRDLALVAGSAVGFRLAPPEGDPTDWYQRLLKRLQDIERNGIGLRRSEGFGFVAFNHPVYQGGRDLAGTRTGRVIPDILRLGTAQASNTEPSSDGLVELVFIQKWSFGLQHEFKPERFRQAKDAPWEAVARWLWHAADRPVDALTQELRSFGELPSTAPRTHGPHLLIDTSINRESKGHFAGAKAKAALDHLCERLDEIPSSVSDATRQTAIQMLANRLVAEVAQNQEEE